MHSLTPVGGVMDCCPVCGGKLEQVKCKVVCKECKALISNCNGD